MRIGDLYSLSDDALRQIADAHERALELQRRRGQMPDFKLRQYNDVIISQVRAILRSREHTA